METTGSTLAEDTGTYVASFTLLSSRMNMLIN